MSRDQRHQDVWIHGTSRRAASATAAWEACDPSAPTTTDGAGSQVLAARTRALPPQSLVRARRPPCFSRSYSSRTQPPAIRAALAVTGIHRVALRAGGVPLVDIHDRAAKTGMASPMRSAAPITARYRNAPPTRAMP